MITIIGFGIRIEKTLLIQRENQKPSSILFPFAKAKSIFTSDQKQASRRQQQQRAAKLHKIEHNFIDKLVRDRIHWYTMAELQNQTVFHHQFHTQKTAEFTCSCIELLIFAVYRMKRKKINSNAGTSSIFEQIQSKL